MSSSVALAISYVLCVPPQAPVPLTAMSAVARFFDATIGLCAELCKGRYRPAMEVVSSAYPLPALMKVLQTPVLMRPVCVCTLRLVVGRLGDSVSQFPPALADIVFVPRR